MTHGAAGAEGAVAPGAATTVAAVAEAAPAELRAPCQPRPFTCSSSAPVLGIDTSHFSVLARLAVTLATSPEGISQDAHFKDLVQRHTCCGLRRCVVSNDVLEEELLPVDSWPRKYAPGIHADAFDAVEARVAGDTSTLRPRPPEAVGVIDQTLVGAVLCVGSDADEIAALVTNDQQLYEWIEDIVEEGSRVLPFHSVSFLVNMVRCGAMTEAEVALSFATEAEHLDSYENPIAPRLRDEKVDRIRRATNEVASIGTRAARARP